MKTLEGKRGRAIGRQGEYATMLACMRLWDRESSVRVMYVVTMSSVEVSELMATPSLQPRYRFVNQGL